MARERKKSQSSNSAKYETLIIDDVKYKTLLTNKFKNRKKYQPKNPKEITAFIPGTIKDIFIKQNSNVKEGDKLLILEAMKMENEVLSPMSGKIKKIWVKMGERVTKEQLLIELE